MRLRYKAISTESINPTPRLTLQEYRLLREFVPSIHATPAKISPENRQKESDNVHVVQVNTHIPTDIPPRNHQIRAGTPREFLYHSLDIHLAQVSSLRMRETSWWTSDVGSL